MSRTNKQRFAPRLLGFRDSLLRFCLLLLAEQLLFSCFGCAARVIGAGCGWASRCGCRYGCGFLGGRCRCRLLLRRQRSGHAIGQPWAAAVVAALALVLCLHWFWQWRPWRGFWRQGAAASALVGLRRAARFFGAEAGHGVDLLKNNTAAKAGPGGCVGVPKGLEPIMQRLGRGDARRLTRLFYTPVYAATACLALALFRALTAFRDLPRRGQALSGRATLARRMPSALTKKV